MNINAGNAQSATWSLAPMLSVRGGKQAIAFYQAAFGAVEVYHVEDPNGAVVSRLSIQGAEFWLADEAPEHGNFSPATLGGSTVRLVLIGPDPEAVIAGAVAAGAQVVNPLITEHGWRTGRIVDPFGQHWEIGQPLEAEETTL